MCKPRNRSPSRVFFSPGGGERSSPLGSRPTIVLLGLGIGCTIVLSGLLPVGDHHLPASFNCGGGDEARAVTSSSSTGRRRDGAVPAGNTPPMWVTPERRQLPPPAEFLLTPSPSFATGDNKNRNRAVGGKEDGFGGDTRVGDTSVRDTTSVGDRCVGDTALPLVGLLFDPILARLTLGEISPKRSVVSSSDGTACASSANKRAEDIRSVAESTTERRNGHLKGEDEEQNGVRAPRDDEEEIAALLVAASTTPERDDALAPPKRARLTPATGDGHDGSGGDGIRRVNGIRRGGNATTDAIEAKGKEEREEREEEDDEEEEMDIPDGEWRRYATPTTSFYFVHLLSF